jgi:hypothetical protein
MGAIYTQPYSIAPTFGMVAWESWKSLRDARWKVPVSATICCAFAAGAYLPWYLYSWPTWRHGEEVSGIPKFHWSAGLAQDIFKGFSGGDFLCSALLLGAAVAGARSATVPIATRTSLVFTALFVFSTVLLVDAWKGYFFAARQFLFAVPVVAVLAGLGLQRCFESKRAAGLTLAILLLGACLRSDGAIALNNREDWAAAARALEMTSKEGYCLKFVAEELGGVTLYAVFAPGLRSSLCRGPLQAEPKVALVWHTYLRPSQITRNQGALWAAGFVPADILRVGGTTIQRAILQ